MAYSAQNDSGEKKQQAPLFVIIAVAVALLAFLGWWAYQNFAPSGPPKLNAAEQDAKNTLEQIVLKSGGDMSKISPEDMAKAKAIAGNEAGKALGGTVMRLKMEGKLK